MRVLVLEDHPEHRAYLFEVFRAMGLSASSAVTTDEVVHLAIAQQPDLIVLDIMLRSGDGRDAARRLKSTPSTAGIPILAVTGLPVEQRETCLAAGCDEFLTKPFRVHQLSAVVQSLLDRSPATAGPSGS
jgi:CheY-like chemotaxis protein